uniref:BRCT domain-containing protein n=1 Tax=Caenorhabditis tropicalis TaxID=1561998 RepID=A0A1I7T8P5_9PELO
MATPPRDAPPMKKLRRSELCEIHDNSVLCEDDGSDSPYTLYFVKLSDEKPTDLETKNLDQTFELAKNSGVMPEWIYSEDVERIQNSDDFFVFPCFRGKLFRKLQARKIKLFGPPIILECIKEQKQLPNWNHPIHSSVFEGAKICFTSLDQEQRLELQEKIGWMCGVVGNDLYHETTHLIAGKAIQTDKYKAAVNNSIKLMKTKWVEDLWKTSQTTVGKFSALNKDAISSYELRVFEGIEMAISSIDGADRNRLIQLVEEHGGTIPGNMSRSRCTHLITEKTSGQKYIKATEWKSVHVVQTRWVRKCIDLGYLIDEKKYHPKYLSADHIRCSTPKKDTTVTESGPDLSSIAGPGGRLTSSFNMSSVSTPLDLSYRQSCSSFVSMVSSSNVSSSTVASSNVVTERTRTVEKAGIDHSTPPSSRTFTVPRVRQSTTRISRDLVAADRDPIDDLRKKLIEDIVIYLKIAFFTYVESMNQKRSNGDVS